MSDWTYEPLIVKLKAALAEAESEADRKEHPARTVPQIPISATERGDSESDLPRS